MKIQTKTFSEFLKKVKLNDIEQVSEVIFDFGEQGLKIKAMSPTNTVKVSAILLPSAFVVYEAIGEIGIQDLPTVIRILDKFGEELDISVVSNVIEFKDSVKEMTTELMDVQFIKRVDDMKDAEFTDQFTMQVKNLQTMIEDAKINKDFSLTIKTVEKGVSFETTGKYKFKRNVHAPEAKGGVEIQVGGPFINSLTNLTSDVVLSVRENFPVKIMEKTENSIITIVAAPMLKK